MTEELGAHKYYLKKGPKVVYMGITYDLRRREAQHQKEFPGSHIVSVGRRTTREAARKWERAEGKQPLKNRR